MTLNNGNIVSTDGNGNSLPATLYATDSFNLANGTIGPDVTLAGGANSNKRTDGTVTFEGANSDYAGSGEIFVNQGYLNNDTSGQYTDIPPSLTTTYVWTDASGDGDWNNTSANWSLDGTPHAWPRDDATNDYVAVFPAALPVRFRSPLPSSHARSNSRGPVWISRMTACWGTTFRCPTPAASM